MGEGKKGEMVLTLEWGETKLTIRKRKEGGRTTRRAKHWG
jgi:hypothetical protein